MSPLSFASRASSAVLTRIAFAAFVLLVVTLSVYHEPWRDEADAWLVARDQSLGEILYTGTYSGTPALWYFIQAPFAKLGAPYETQQLLHLLIAVSAAGLLLFRAPFPLALRLALVFGYFLSFEYTVVARNYSSGILLCFAAAAMDQQRLRWAPLYGLVIGLAASASAHFTFFAMALLVPFAWDALQRRTDWWVWCGTGVAAAGIAAAVWQLWPPAKTVADFVATEVVVRSEPFQIYRTFTHAFVPRLGNEWWKGVIGVLAVGVACARLWSAPRAATVFFLCSAGLGYIFVFKFVTGVRHYGLLLIALVVALWMAEGELRRSGARTPLISRRVFTAAMLVLLLPSVVMAARAWRLEIKYPFSEASDVATFIKVSGLDQARIAAHRPMSSVLAFLPRRTLWFPSRGGGEDGSYARYDRRSTRTWNMPMSEAVARTKVQCPGWDDPFDPVLLLLTEPLPDAEKEGLQLLYRTPGRPWGDPFEVFYLYAPLTFEPQRPGLTLGGGRGASCRAHPTSTAPGRYRWAAGTRSPRRSRS